MSAAPNRTPAADDEQKHSPAVLLLDEGRAVQVGGWLRFTVLPVLTHAWQAARGRRDG